MPGVSPDAWTGAVLSSAIYLALALLPDGAYQRVLGRAPSRGVRVVLRVVAGVALVGLVAGIVVLSTVPVKDR